MIKVHLKRREIEKNAVNGACPVAANVHIPLHTSYSKRDADS